MLNLQYNTLTEILRKYPPAPLLDRKCVKKYTIEPINSDEVPVELNPGDQIWIANGALLHDPKYFPNPDKFDPERFNDKNKHLINPYTFLPFGVGPRSCLGSRFALMQSKILIFYIYLKFNTVPIKKTEIPIKINKKYLILTAENGSWIGLERRR